jgi:methionine sulfoxide reductase heme-binding subunit
MSSTWLWYASRATGLVALVLLSATTVLGLLTAGRLSTPRWPGFAIQELHRRVSLLAVSFLAVHVGSAVADRFVDIPLLAVVVPFTSGYKAIGIALGALSIDFLAVVVVSSLLRRRIRPATWRTLHWLAYLSWPVAVIHGLTMGTDLRLRWAAALTALCVVAVALAAVWRMTRKAAARSAAAATDGVRRRQPGVAIKHLPPRAGVGAGTRSVR